MRKLFLYSLAEVSSKQMNLRGVRNSRRNFTNSSFRLPSDRNQLNWTKILIWEIVFLWKGQACHWPWPKDKRSGFSNTFPFDQSKFLSKLAILHYIDKELIQYAFVKHVFHAKNNWKSCHCPCANVDIWYELPA